MSHRIVVLDGHTLNPGDLDWSPLSSSGELTVHDRTPPDAIVERAAGCDISLTNKTPLDAGTIQQLPDLRYIGVTATGYNVVDTQAASAANVIVTNVPTYGTDSVAQHTAGLLLELARRVSIHSTAVREGRWAACPDFCFTLAPITELTGKTMGIVGLGRIGVAFARIAAALGMRLIGHAPRWPDADRLAGLQIESVSLDDLFAHSDAVSLHCPLTDKTHHLVNASRLAAMKPMAFLVNTSRGPLIDESALADALVAGRLAGAALDVLEQEPPPLDHPLFRAPNCIITPHMACTAKAARERLLQTVIDNIRAFLNGSPINVVNA